MKAKASASTFSPIHELNEHSHRIVVLAADGTNSPGEWYPLGDVAWHEDGLFASAWPPGLFPPGIFRVRGVPHQVLGGK